MSDIDKRLEQLAQSEALWGEAGEPSGEAILAAALLRARKLLEQWHVTAHSGAPCMKLVNGCPALADTELEESLL